MSKTDPLAALVAAGERLPVMGLGLQHARLSPDVSAFLVAAANARPALAALHDLVLIAELFLEGHGDCGNPGCLCAGARETLKALRPEPA